jgi:hypothetical protein
VFKNKLIIILVPFRHKSWVRKQVAGFSGSEQIQYAPPREYVQAHDKTYNGRLEERIAVLTIPSQRSQQPGCLRPKSVAVFQRHV